MRLFPLTAYLLGLVGPSSVRIGDSRGGLMAALVFYTFIRSAIALDVLICLPVAIVATAFKRVRGLRR